MKSEITILLEKQTFCYEDLVKIMAILRSPSGCPWDKEQTHISIRNNLIEETYEAIEAIDSKNDELLKEELGDILLQVVFHCEIAKSENHFNIDDVCDGICKKLILRHPHIFAQVQANTTKEVLNNWDEIKKEEKGHNFHSDTLNSVAKSLPSLMRSQKIQKKAAKVGFDWDNIDGAFAKVYEELEELKDAIKQGEKLHIREELGDLLFATVNISRFIDCDSEEALYLACDKFCLRFEKMEQLAIEQSRRLEDMTLEEMDVLWNRTKISNH
jgi:tetrapyrrole methylase family protein/MazG family protein